MSKVSSEEVFEEIGSMALDAINRPSHKVFMGTYVHPEKGNYDVFLTVRHEDERKKSGNRRR